MPHLMRDPTPEEGEYDATWRSREETPPDGQWIWASDGDRVWLLVGDGEPIPASARNVLFWTPAAVPRPPNARKP